MVEALLLLPNITSKIGSAMLMHAAPCMPVYAVLAKMFSLPICMNTLHCMTKCCFANICDRVCNKGRFWQIEFSSHSSATRIALNSDLIRAYSLAEKRGQ